MSRTKTNRSHEPDRRDSMFRRGKSPAKAVALTSIRLDKRLADEAAEVLGVRSRTEAVHAALREIVALKRFKNLMLKYGGKLEFSGRDEYFGRLRHLDLHRSSSYRPSPAANRNHYRSGTKLGRGTGRTEPGSHETFRARVCRTTRSQPSNPDTKRKQLPRVGTSA